MATSTQANFATITEANAHSQGIDGGLNLKSDPSRLKPPATTRSDNAWYQTPGNVNQLPAFASTMQANTSHVYSVHPRDLQPPSTSGDVMVHGEVRDDPTSPTNLFTSPLWSDGGGQVTNSQQPVLPVNARTRIMTGRLSVAGNLGTDRQNIMTARQEAGFTAASPQKCAMAYYDGTANLNVTFSLMDGQVELPYTLTHPIGAAQFVQIAGVQGTDYWIAVVLNGQTLTRHKFDFKGEYFGSFTLTTTAQAASKFLPLSTNSGFVGNTFDIVQHNGRTLIGWVSQVSTSSFNVALYDQGLGAFLATGITAPASANTGFALSSPYSHETQTDVAYLGVVFSGKLYVTAQSAYNVDGVNVSNSGVPLVRSSKSGAQDGWSTVDYTTTMAAVVFDGQGGVGTGAHLGFVIYQHYPEQLDVTGPTIPTFWYQNISVTRITFKANVTSGLAAGSSIYEGAAVFRTPSGAALCSKAFTLSPSSGGNAGLSGAKNAYALVRCGAYEPRAGFTGNYDGVGFTNWWTYGQPTYFLLDHQARIVGRYFESLGPLGDGYALANNTMYNVSTNYGAAQPPFSLSMPLISNAPNDLSVLEITLPCWVQTNQSPFSAFSAPGGLTYTVGPPANVIMQPGCVQLSVSAQSNNCPPIQAGPYTVLSGAMTCVHDGRGVVEANYHFLTHNLIPKATYATGAPGSGSAGNYYWVVVWEWYDSLGRMHRSAPSAAWPDIVPAGNYLTGATIYCPAPVTAKSAVGGVMYARLYRSTLNNTTSVFYLVSTTAITAYSGSNRFVTLTDNGLFLDPSASQTAGMRALTAQPRLYTSVNAAGTYTFNSTMPPAFYWQVGAKGRAFGLAQVFGQQRLYYTSRAQDRYPFEWNIGNYAPIPPEMGDVRSIEAIDDKIVLFGTRNTALMNNDGPGTASTNEGGVALSNDGFSFIQAVPSPAGVVGSGSPVRIPDGIMFQGYSGVQLVGRDLTVQPIGAFVDPLTGRQVGNPGTVLGRAATLPSLQSVVWANPAGPAIVYNYLTQKWSTWPLLSNASGIVQRLDGTIVAALQPISAGKYLTKATALTPGSDLGVLGDTYAPVYLGDDAAAGLVLETPWILPSGESGGEAQLWDCTVTGSYLGPHILQVEQAYNYDGRYTAVTKFTVDTAPQFYQYRVRPQASCRVWSVRYRISLLPITSLSANYQMATLGDLVLNFGSMQGTTRLSAAASG